MTNEVKPKSHRRKVRNAFDYDLDGLKERSAKPHPIKDKEGAIVADCIRRLTGRAQVGFVTRWSPEWAKDVRPFRYFFFEDKLCVDVYEDEYGAPGTDVDVMIDSVDMEKDIQRKQELCAEKDLAYVAVRPDEEFDAVQLAAKLGRTKVRKEETAASQGGKIS